MSLPRRRLAYKAPFQRAATQIQVRSTRALTSPSYSQACGLKMKCLLDGDCMGYVWAFQLCTDVLATVSCLLQLCS